MTRRPGLTLDQHRELGAELRAMRNRLVTITREVGNAIGVNSKPVKRARRAYLAVDALYWVLDEHAHSTGTTQFQHPQPATVATAQTEPRN